MGNKRKNRTEDTPDASCSAFSSVSDDSESYLRKQKSNKKGRKEERSKRERHTEGRNKPRDEDKRKTDYDFDSEPKSGVNSEEKKPLVDDMLREFFNVGENLKQAPRLPIMRNMYYLLLHFSFSEPSSLVHCKGSSTYLNMKLNGSHVKVNFKDLLNLSNILFEELDMRFTELLYTFRTDSHDEAGREFILYPCFQVSVEELSLLLRCCMVLLTLLRPYNQGHGIEKSQVLLSLLSKLVSVELSGGKGRNPENSNQKASHGCKNIYDDCGTKISEDSATSTSYLEPSHPSEASLCAVLEVFADELLMDKSLREILLLVDSIRSKSEHIFICRFGLGEIGGVLEVVCSHFILSLSSEKAFRKFLNRLFWQHDNEIRAPQMSLTALLSLLLNPVVFSAPKMFHAHLILLLCDAISIRSSSENIILDLKLIDCYLAAFERSVTLYTRHMCSFQKDGHLRGSHNAFEKSSMLNSSSHLDFEAHLLPATRDKIQHLLTKFNDSWRSYLCTTSLEAKSKLVADSTVYTKKSLCVFDKSQADEVLSILSCIILRGSSDDVSDSILDTKGEKSSQDIYLLASILKLMSCSMLQVTIFLRHNHKSGSLKTVEGFSSCKEYDVMMRAAASFENFKVNLPVQKFLSDIMEEHSARHTKSKWMLLHFSGLLSLSYVSRLEFLVKDCIFAMITLLGLFVFEEGNLIALGSVTGSRLNSVSSTPGVQVGETLVDRKSGRAVALNFLKIRTLYLGTASRTSFSQDDQTGSSEDTSDPNHMDSVVGIQEEGYDGEDFLRCISREGTLKSSDIDDLSDFIECKPGKDYSVWLKCRQVFRDRWNEKATLSRWNKKRTAWKQTCKGNRKLN